MKIQQINNDELAINDSGVSSLILGILFVIIGIGIIVAPFVTTSAPWWVSLIGVAVTAIFVWVTFSAKSRHIVLRRTGSSEITDKKILGGKETTSQFEASQVVAVGLETRTEYSNNGSSTGPSNINNTPQRTRVSMLYVLLNDNSEIMLASKQNSNNVAVGGISIGSLGAAPLSKEAKQVAEFFNVPLKAQNQGEGTLQDLTNTIGAIRDGITGTTNDTSSPQAPTPQPPVVAAAPEQQNPALQQPSPAAPQTPPAPAPNELNSLK